MKKQKIGYIGLGKMGLNMVLRMHEKGIDVVAYNRGEEARQEARKKGVVVADSVSELITGLAKPRTVWLMVSNSAVDAVLADVLKHLEPGDTVIDGGNSFYKDSIRRAAELEKKGIEFLDAGVSGGPKGAREGACIMVGGKKTVFKKYQQLFQDLSARSNHSDVLENIRMKSRKKPEEKFQRIYSNIPRNIGIDSGEYAYAHVGSAGAGHFVKMVHNGIEYGMMQALAEGFAVLRNAELRGIDAESAAADGKKIKFGLDLKKIAELYNHKSVIDSRLVGWLASGFEKYGTDLEEISGTVGHLGEGEWTVQAGKELGVPVPVIEASFQFRVASEKNPSYTGKVLSTLRNQFGGHSTGKN